MSKDLKQKKSDYLLELALEEQLEQDEDMKKYPLSEDIEHPHVFSEEHEKRMKELFKMADKVEHQSYRRKKHFQITAGIALFLCLSTATVTQVEAFRLPVFRFFSEVMEKSTYYGVEEVQTELSSRYQMYEPTYVPEGFHVTKVKEEDDYFEIVQSNISKGSALKVLKNHLNIENLEIIAVGNHMNDKELLEVADVGFAVNNAVVGLKDIADYTTKEEYENGVIEIIKKFM